MCVRACPCASWVGVCACVSMCVMGGWVCSVESKYVVLSAGVCMALCMLRVRIIIIL